MLFVLLPAACGGGPVRHKVSPELLADKPAALKADYRRLYEDPDNNRTLNRMRLALKAYRLGYKEIASQTFDKVLLGIEAVYADSEKAAKARSLWYEEGMKDFKGEPYERVMAYFYRGLLYIEEGDLENARACFKGGLLQDSFAEEKKYRADFALMIFMEGWCSLQLHDDSLAHDSFAELHELRPDFSLPGKENNLLMIVETGTSPRKVADGVGHYELKFRRGRHFKEKKVYVQLDRDRRNPMFPMEDVAWQAMTRGGRPLDKILKGQAFFRSTSETVGTVLTGASTLAMEAAPAFRNSNDVALVGAAVGLVGAAGLLLSTQIKAKADTRYWDNLPDGVFVFCRALSPGKHTAHLFYADRNDRLLRNLNLSLKVAGQGPTLVYQRSPSSKL
ncbi:MAG: hypothetical protein ACE5GM_09000 [bacterium]